MKFKTWWKKPWDEVILVVSIILSIYFILKGNGYFT